MEEFLQVCCSLLGKEPMVCKRKDNYALVTQFIQRHAQELSAIVDAYKQEEEQGFVADDDEFTKVVKHTYPTSVNFEIMNNINFSIKDDNWYFGPEQHVGKTKKRILSIEHCNQMVFQLFVKAKRDVTDEKPCVLSIVIEILSEEQFKKLRNEKTSLAELLYIMQAAAKVAFKNILSFPEWQTKYTDDYIDDYDDFVDLVDDFYRPH